MKNTATREDYELLGLKEEETGATEAVRAYEKMKALYSPGSLATYSLMTEEEREKTLRKIEKAYLHISRDISRSESLPLFEPVPCAVVKSDTGEEFPVDAIGSYIRRRREDMGLTLKDISGITRIRSTYLESIEKEAYDLLPSSVYLRGFLIEFAKALGCPDPEDLASRYLVCYGEGVTEK